MPNAILHQFPMTHSPHAGVDGYSDPVPTPLYSRQVKDVRLKVLARAIAPYLFAGHKAHAFNDQRLWDDLSESEREPFVQAALEAIYRQDPLRHEHAIRQVKLAAYRWLEHFAAPLHGAAEAHGTVTAKFVKWLFPHFFETFLSETANVIPDLVNTYQSELVPGDPNAAKATRQALSAQFGGAR